MAAREPRRIETAARSDTGRVRDENQDFCAEFEASDSAKDKITYLYRLLAHDKLIQPLAKGQENEPNMKHKLALWMSRQLPEGHALLQ